MSDREEILGRVRRHARHSALHPGPHPVPALPGGFEAFAARLRQVGGEALGPWPEDGLGRRVAERARARAGTDGRIVGAPTATAWLGPGPWETAGADASPSSFEDVDVAVLLGSAGAAECAAVAVEASLALHRALPFLCRHLMLLLPLPAIAPDLHTAQARLGAGALAHPAWTWVSGPSKTADIEQTLVYGAHGPLSLDVVCVG